MEHKVIIHNGKICSINELAVGSYVHRAAKEQLLKMYCGDGYADNCKILSSQIEDPSNEGRIFQVEI